MESAGIAVPARRADRDIYSVSRLNREVKQLLDRGFGGLWLEAEISNFSRPGSGHWYFSLKDSAAQVRACMFRQRNMLCRFTAKDGQKVLVRARIGLYEPRGDYQLIVDHMEDAGLGALKRQFEELAARLAAEGLFAAERKRKLPNLPRRIGIITSPSGAAIRDILHVLARRFAAIPVLIYPAAVQGPQAHAELIAALGLATRRAECDVLILARGGGSLEDLWAFNHELLARAIAASPIPVVSGVGHEIDLTIADLAADVRAPTPSAAAEIVVPDGAEWAEALAVTAARMRRAVIRVLEVRVQRLRWLIGRAEQVSPTAKLAQQSQRLDELEMRMGRALRRLLDVRVERLRWLKGRAEQMSPAATLAQQSRRLGELDLRMARAMPRLLAERRSHFGEWRTRLWQASPVAHLRTATAREAALKARLRIAMLDAVSRARERYLPLVRTLHAVSPLATLDRGYAIVRKPDGSVVRDPAEIPPGTEIEALLLKGRVRARVEP